MIVYIMKTNNNLLFLIGCLGTRLLIAVISKYIPLDYLPYVGYLALLPFIGFIYLYINDLRQIKGFAGGKVWWNNYRPLHAVLYLLFALYAIKKKPFAWIVLLIDALIGFMVWIIHKNL